MSRTVLAAVFLGIALLATPAARAEAIEAVTISGKGVLTVCRNWMLFRTCKPYAKIELPQQVAVGDEIKLTFGSNPKDYTFQVVEIRQKGAACLLLSHISQGAEDRERIEVARCDPVASRAGGSR